MFFKTDSFLKPLIVPPPPFFFKTIFYILTPFYVEFSVSPLCVLFIVYFNLFGWCFPPVFKKSFLFVIFF